MKKPDAAPPILEWEILLQPQWISADLANYQSLRFLESQQDIIAAAIDGEAGAGSRMLARQVPPFPRQLLPLALLRQTALARMLRTMDGIRPLVDSPMVTIASRRLIALSSQPPPHRRPARHRHRRERRVLRREGF